ncbi:MAG: bifunctional oligoribonuclease/PAP phosphatase NrnA [Deltaproteobacteria bacterium]|nr:bifunctional oligoribonuclease/PAP phosphatase NrnA [Deltaproteobacteria bacterium]
MKATIADIIRKNGRFEIITHAWPDADAIGSAYALYMALHVMNKEVRFICPTPIPEHLLLTPAPEENLFSAPEISLLVDVSDMGMIGDIRPEGMVVVIDHHKTNQGFGFVSWVCPNKSSASEMVYELLIELDIEITSPIATNIYMGIFGDTGGFVHTNTTARVFEIANRLTLKGADPSHVANQLRKNKSTTYYKILCLAMERIRICDSICASYITLDDLDKLRAGPNDASGIIEDLSSLAGVELSIFLRDVNTHQVHCSIRSRDGISARLTAQAFGGGGHDRAAGFTLEGRAEGLVGDVIKEGLKWVRMG